MCGRFTLTTNPADYFKGFRFPSIFAPRFNIAPMQPLLAVPNDGQNTATFFLWGLLPYWAKDASMAARMINARGETLAEKPSFRGAYKYRRCLIFADGFYEWEKVGGRKIPHYIFMQSREPFAFAGLWSDWESPDGSRVKTCIIITTSPNEVVAPIHARMPVILPRNAYRRWLSRDRGSLDDLLRPYPAEGMEAHPVSNFVNNAENDGAECVVPTEEFKTLELGI